jgi:D-alanine-D-alanine ligase
MDETAEFDKQETVDALENSLRLMGHETDPIGNTFQLIDALAAGKRWDMVFNIAEGCMATAGNQSFLQFLISTKYLMYSAVR